MKGSTFSIIAGVLALIGGIVALVFPLPAGLAVTVLVGWAFLVSGVIGMWAGFADRDLSGRWWVFFFGLVELVLGIWMLANPLSGLVSLTVLAGLMLILSGLGRFGVASGLRGTQTFWFLALSGVISIGLGIYALVALQTASAILIGTLLAIELISVGAALVALGIVLKRNTGL